MEKGVVFDPLNIHFALTASAKQRRLGKLAEGQLSLFDAAELSWAESADRHGFAASVPSLMSREIPARETNMVNTGMAVGERLKELPWV